MKTRNFIYIIAAFIFLLAPSCSEESDMMDDMEQEECLEDLSFEENIQALINTNCAYSGCHISGTGLPVLSNYEGVKAQVENGRFEDRVLVRQNMPPGNASGPTELSEADLFLLQCWIDQGYPE